MQTLYDHLMYQMSVASDTPYELLTSARRFQPIVTARFIVWHYLYHRDDGYTLKRIGQLSGKDHTSVRHGINTIAEELKQDRAETCVLYSRFLRLLADSAAAKSYKVFPHP